MGKLNVYAGPNELFVQAEGRLSAVVISFSGKITTKSIYRPTAEPALSVTAVVGIVKGLQAEYLIVITNASTVLDDTKTVYAVESAVAIPLDSERAATAIIATAKSQAPIQEDSDTDEDIEQLIPEADAAPIELEQDGNQLVADSLKATLRATNKRQFWRTSPFVPPSQPSLGPIASAGSPPSSSTSLLLPFVEPLLDPVGLTSTAVAQPSAPLKRTVSAMATKNLANLRLALDKKVIGTILSLIKGMYYSTNSDITHPLQKTYGIKSTLPIYKQADIRFWWSASMAEPFVEAHSKGLIDSDLIIVLMQGFIRSVPCTLPAHDSQSTTVALELTVISRRSVERPGLRYQRRGVNDAGGVANFCETEFIISATRNGLAHVSSFVQTRGSIPLFWSQHEISLKPLPVLERTPEESLVAMKLHFDTQIRLYGRQIIVNLAEQTGKEAGVVEAYRSTVDKTGNQLIKYVGFDFHKQCRQMHYENIELHLINSDLKSDLDELSCFWATPENVLSSQTGVVRTNCIDCLDRTNVVQSALARTFLERSLVNIGIAPDSDGGEGFNNFNSEFMTIWADNGDAISRQYAGTSALKGDFTRTGQRNWRGVFNDATNSITRLVHNISNDYFRQAVIDATVGVNSNAIIEFSSTLSSRDPRDIKLAQIRTGAIQTAASTLLLDGETQIGAATFLSPAEVGTLKPGLKGFEEKVLLLSDRAVYIVDIEFNLDVVKSFLRIPLADLVSIQMGVYITSVLEVVARDPVENYGYVINYQSTGAILQRTQTYSMRLRSSIKVKTVPVVSGVGSVAPVGETRSMAFKAIRRGAEIKQGGMGEILTAKAAVQLLIEQMRNQYEKIGAGDLLLVERPIVTEKDAEASVAVLDRVKDSIARFLWL